ncbi:MAG: hypothetical protein HKN17_06400, partial [Rhodothermales bacterium]|nr:hypothetical protein [Rhodothermales bacterium]
MLRISLVVLLAVAAWASESHVAAQSASPPVSLPALPEDVFVDASFRYVGPSRGGRVTTVAGHRSHPRTFYMGATGGGVWKTTDAGQSWHNVSDGYFQTASIGSIDVADSNPDVVYVGTGSDGIRSNVIIGKGVYKSTDGGQTWTFMGLGETGQIGAVVVHPTNDQVVWVAALGSPFGPNPERGVFRSVDGGLTWDHVLFVSERTGAIDLELNPANPDEIYASVWRAERKPWTIISGDDGSEDGIYVSRDGGRTWERKDAGLPDDLIGKIDFAVTPADPSRVYALVEAKPEKEGLYRSNDRGETWHLVSNQGFLMTRPFYYTNVDADPTDADVVYVNNLGFHRSDDAGETWRRISTPHGDNHDMWINPDDPDIFIQSNDGGANVTLDGGETWSTQHNQPTAELYQVDIDDGFPYRLYAGQQDNSTIAVPSAPIGGRPGGRTARWESVGGCETGPVVPKPGDPDVVYANCKGRFGVYDRRTGRQRDYHVGGVYMYGRNPADLPYRFQRVVPIEVSPHDANTVYHGSQYVHRTRDGGVTWEQISPDLTAFRSVRQMVSGGPITRDVTGEEHYSTLYVIEESPVREGVIWAGANDGPLHVTRDGGRSWTDVTPADLPPEGRVNIIDPSPHDGAKAYVAVYRTLLGDDRPYIYRTVDSGASWTLLTPGDNGIPDDTPTRVIREDPDQPGLLYAGTEYGIYVSLDDGASWLPFRQNMPVTPITDMKVADGDLFISTMGRSFWVMDNLTPLHQMADGLDAEAVQLLQPRDARRIRSGGGSYGFGDVAAVRPQYRPDGIMVDYWIPEGLQADVSLEVRDASGAVVRSYGSGGPGVRSEEDQEMRAPFMRRSGRPSLETSPGLHRVVWDMTIDTEGRSPLALPGTYTFRLTAGDRVETRSAE